MTAMPNVIKNGRQIGYDPNWKGRGYPSYIFAAPVKVAGTDVYVAAVVNQLPDKRFYLSEMLDSDGNYVRIEESPSGNSKNGLPMGPEVQQGRDHAGPEELSEGSNPSATAEPMPLPKNIVLDQSDEVKKNPSANSAYMNKNGQKETASSLSGDAEAYRVTSDNATKSDAVSMNSISGPEAEVNGNPSANSDYYDEFENWGADPNREGVADPMAERDDIV